MFVTLLQFLLRRFGFAVLVVTYVNFGKYLFEFHLNFVRYLRIDK